MTEEKLVGALNHHDELVRRCVSGGLSFKDFMAEYGDFWDLYALDGHESDAEGLHLLASFESRIALHKDVADHVMQGMCSDADALDTHYTVAGRFGSAEAFRRLIEVAKRHSVLTVQ